MPSLFTAFFVSNIFKIDFLIDTGASLSLFPLRYSSALTIVPSVVTLRSVDGRQVSVHGESFLTVSSRKLRRSYQWTFDIANVPNAILGADFLSANKLSVSCANRRLIYEVTSLYASCDQFSTSNSSPVFAKPPLTHEIEHLLQEYSDVL